MRATTTTQCRLETKPVGDLLGPGGVAIGTAAMKALADRLHLAFCLR